MTTFSVLRHSKFYPNRDFWFENKPSGNPGADRHGAEFLEKVKVPTLNTRGPFLTSPQGANFDPGSEVELSPTG
jgi:hypothetical protein